MVELDEKAAGIIKNLLDTDLHIRKKGLDQLRDATYGNWDIKYREYLWKAIEEEKTKSFQKTMVKFAVQKMQEDSLRKMIRIIENNDLHAGSTSYIAGKYMDLETPIVREALIKSLQRDPRFIPQFVLRLLNDFEFYKKYNDEKYRTFIRDMLTEPVPFESRKEFFIRIMNWYFKGETNLILQAKIWDIIAEDKELQMLLLDGFYNKPVKHSAKFVEPAYFPKLLPFKRTRPFDYTRNDEIFSWIEKSDALDFLYGMASTEDKETRTKYIAIIAKLEIPEFSFDTTRDGSLANIYQDWDKITYNNADAYVVNVEEFERSYLEPLFPELQENPELMPADILQGLNPHTLFYFVLRYLPRYLLADQITENEFIPTRIEALIALKSGKYWTEQHQKNLLRIELIGSSQIWKQVLADCVTILNTEKSVSLRREAAHLLYYLVDLLEEPIDLEIFWNRIEEKFRELKQPVNSFMTSSELEVIERIQHDFVEELNHVINLDAEDDETYQKELEAIVQLTDSYIQDLQTLTDKLLEGKEVLAAVERELIKYYETILPLSRINYWFELLIQHVEKKIEPIQSFSNRHKGHFDLYIKRIGQLSEYFRELQLTIGDPKEFTTGDKIILEDLANLNHKIKAKNNNLGLRPYKYLDSSDSDSIIATIERSMIELRDEFELIDPTNLRDTLFEYVEQLEQGTQDYSPLYFRVQDKYDIAEKDIEALNKGESMAIAAYVMRQGESDEMVVLFKALFGRLTDKQQLELIEIYNSMLELGLVEFTPRQPKDDKTNIPSIFKSSTSVKVRTRAAFLLK